MQRGGPPNLTSKAGLRGTPSVNNGDDDKNNDDDGDNNVVQLPKANGPPNGALRVSQNQAPVATMSSVNQSGLLTNATPYNGQMVRYTCLHYLCPQCGIIGAFPNDLTSAVFQRRR